MTQDPLDRTAPIWAFVSYALAAGLVFRAITCITRNRLRETPFEQVADISPPFLITAAVLIIAGHVLERWSTRWQTLGLFGHVLGWVFTWNFMITLYIGVINGTTGGVSGEVWFLVGLAHVIRAWFLREEGGQVDSASIVLIVTAALGVPGAVLSGYALVRRANQPYDKARNLLLRARDILEAKGWFYQLPKSLTTDWDEFLKIKTEGDRDEPDKDS